MNAPRPQNWPDELDKIDRLSRSDAARVRDFFRTSSSNAAPPSHHPTFPPVVDLVLVFLLALLLASSYLLDGPDDHSHEHAQAQDLEAAQRQERANLEALRLAQAACGVNTGVIERTDGTLACSTKRGRPTGVVIAGAYP